MNLYSTHAKEFSTSRQYPWKGWEQLLDLFPKESLSILDVGCGNGRFLEYVRKLESSSVTKFGGLEFNGLKVLKYVGIDNSDVLLNIARNNYEKSITNYEVDTKPTAYSLQPMAAFLKKDLNTPDWAHSSELTAHSSKFNLIVAFGLLHHLKDNETRKVFFENVKSLLSENGIFIASFWQFKNIPNWEKKIIEDKGNNDYILSFGKQDATRFCHYTHETEAKSLIQDAGFKIIKDFYSDGRTDNLNFYIASQV